VLSVVFPAHNEEPYLEAAVRAVADGLASRGLEGEIFVVENGSTDGTAALAERLTHELPAVHAISLGKADYGAALRAGFLAAHGDVVVNFDVDYYDLAFLDAALALLDRDGGPAIVVGSKRATGAVDARAWPRRLVTTVFSVILRRGFGLRVSDTHGMKAMRRAPLVPLARTCVLDAELFDTELIIRAERAGLVTAEVPVTTVETRPARTPITRRIPRAITGLVRLRRALADTPTTPGR
jgi:glycosyltransferase involved in cell wall biosynthesis